MHAAPWPQAAHAFTLLAPSLPGRNKLARERVAQLLTDSLRYGSALPLRSIAGRPATRIP